MHDHDPIDDRIRDLLGRAVADAPPPPDLGEPTVASNPAPGDGSRDRNRWLLGGVTGLSVAAALVALVLFARPDDLAEPVVPATLSSTTAVPNPDTTHSTTPGTAAERSPASSSDSTSTSTSPSTTTSTTSTTGPAPAVPPLGRVTVAAGPNGVNVTGAEGVEATVTSEPMTIAFADRGGRVFMQRSDETRNPAADTTILVMDPAVGSVGPLRLPDELSGALRLHGVADIEDLTVLLVETSPGNCANFENCDGALWAYLVDEGTATELDRMSVWEAGWSRLHVTESGSIVGTISSEASSGLYSASLTGDRPVDPVTVGLEQTYYDCSTCPSAFSVDPDGTHLAWLEYDIETFQHTLVVSAIDGSMSSRTLLVDPDGSVCCLDGEGPGIPVAPSLEVMDLAVVGDEVHGRIVVNEASHGDRRNPVTIDLPAGTVTERADAVTTTFGTAAASDIP